MSKFDDAFQSDDADFDPVEHVRAAVHINGGDLRAELERNPSDLAHYGSRFATAHRRFLAMKIKVDEVRAVVSMEVRETMIDLGRKTTESIIEETTSIDQRVREVRAELVEAEFEREQMRAVCDALRAKRDNLNSLVYLARAELAGTSGFRDPGGQQ